MSKTAEDLQKELDTLTGVFVGALSTMLGQDEVGVKSLLFEGDGNLKDNAKEAIEQADQGRIQVLKDEGEKEAERQFGRVKRESIEEVEKKVLQMFGVESSAKDVIGVIQDVIKAKSTSEPGSPAEPDLSKITEAELARIPAFLLKEKEWNGKTLELEGKIESTKDEVGKDWQRKFDRSFVLEKAAEVRQGLDPILSKDPERAKKQLRLFEMDMDGLHWDVVGEGKEREIVLYEDEERTKRMMNPNGHAVKFDSVVDGIVRSNYDIPEGEQRQTLGDPKGGQGGGQQPKPGEGSGGYQLPKNLGSRDAYANELFRLGEEGPQDQEKQTELGNQLRAMADAEGIVV